MTDLMYVLGFLALWFVVQFVVLPKLGLPA